MKILYADTNLHFTMENASVQALNIVFERFTRTLPSHSHGSGCYEIHYIGGGQGRLLANGRCYDIMPNTLYVTGPHVEHAQSSLAGAPMQEYCIYLQLKRPKGKALSPLLNAFCSTPFWLGQDTQGIYTLMQLLFSELERRGIGWQNQVTLLLSQLVIYMVRNYRGEAGAQLQAAVQESPGAGSAAHKSLVIEKYFLFEYQNLSLKELARRLSLSPRQTQRLLMSYYNKSFQEKKAEARMSAAAILLGDKKQVLRNESQGLPQKYERAAIGLLRAEAALNIGHSSHTTPFCSITFAYSADSPVAITAYAVPAFS